MKWLKQQLLQGELLGLLPVPPAKVPHAYSEADTIINLIRQQKIIFFKKIPLCLSIFNSKGASKVEGIRYWGSRRVMWKVPAQETGKLEWQSPALEKN